MRGLVIRFCAFGGLVIGFSQGVIRPIEKAMNCSSDGICKPEESTVTVADFFVPMGIGLLGGLALGLAVVWVIAQLVPAREPSTIEE